MSIYIYIYKYDVMQLIYVHFPLWSFLGSLKLGHQALFINTFIPPSEPLFSPLQQSLPFKPLPSPAITSFPPFPSNLSFQTPHFKRVASYWGRGCSPIEVMTNWRTQVRWRRNFICDDVHSSAFTRSAPVRHHRWPGTTNRNPSP